MHNTGACPAGNVLTLFINLLLTLYHLHIISVRDYCQTEQFKATCADDEVILITSAQYGRMSSGRCVKQNYGYIGCAANVLGISDSKCSGRNRLVLLLLLKHDKKTDRPHSHDYLHTATDYGHTDKYIRLVMTAIALCCTW